MFQTDPTGEQQNQEKIEHSTYKHISAFEQLLDHNSDALVAQHATDDT